MRPLLRRMGIGIATASIFFGVAIAVIPQHINAHARDAASSFCHSVQVGDSVESLFGKAKASGIDLAIWEPQSGVIRHQAWFSGFLLNAYECDIRSRDGRVISAIIEAHTD